MDCYNFIRNEIVKGLEQLDFELLTHQYGDDEIIHYFEEPSIFSRGGIAVRPDKSGLTDPNILGSSRIKLETKLAVRDALIWEEYENNICYGCVEFPFRDIYHNELYFLEGKGIYDELFDLFFGMFFPEREKNSHERLVIRNIVLIVLKDVRDWI